MKDKKWDIKFSKRILIQSYYVIHIITTFDSPIWVCNEKKESIEYIKWDESCLIIFLFLVVVYYNLSKSYLDEKNIICLPWNTLHIYVREFLN